MKTNKKGISLIVLVITIIVIIILAAAIILSLNNNNPIAKAKEAVDASDKSEAQSAFNVWIGTVMADKLNAVTVKSAIIKNIDTDIDIYVGNSTTAEKATVSTVSLGLDGLKSISVENNVVTDVAK